MLFTTKAGCLSFTEPMGRYEKLCDVLYKKDPSYLSFERIGVKRRGLMLSSFSIPYKKNNVYKKIINLSKMRDIIVL